MIMKKLKKLIPIYSPGALWVLLLVGFGGCYPNEDLSVPQNQSEQLIINELDEYIDENFTQRYGIAVRYKFVDSHLLPGQRTTPPRLENVRPMLDFIQEFWIDPYLEVENGEVFFENHVPSEIILFGGLIFQGNTVLLGIAESGARISLLDVNSIDPEDPEWILFQLGTIYHEFAHVVHQRYKLPTGYETITPTGYTSPGSWFNITEDEALNRGFVSPYGSSSPNEDYAELVAAFLFDPDFETNFMIEEENCIDADCESRNAGKAFIKEKLAAITDHHQRVTGVSLEDLRTATQAKINN